MFLLLGLCLVGLSAYFGFFRKPSTTPNPKIGTVYLEMGKATIYRGGTTKKENLTKRALIHNLDSIETQDTSEASIDFESAFRVRILAGSLVTFEKVSDENVVLIIKRGDVRVDNVGRENVLFIAKNGERLSAQNYAGSPLAETPVDNPVTTTTINAEQDLTNSEIEQVMTSNKNSFFKCYTQLLQKAPGSKGEVTLSFTIENSGKISVTEITAMSLNFGNDDFKKCLIEVLKRIEFKKFKGPQIAAFFPLKFE